MGEKVSGTSQTSTDSVPLHFSLRWWHSLWSSILLLLFGLLDIPLGLSHPLLLLLVHQLYLTLGWLQVGTLSTGHFSPGLRYDFCSRTGTRLRSLSDPKDYIFGCVPPLSPSLTPAWMCQWLTDLDSSLETLMESLLLNFLMGTPYLSVTSQ